MTADDGATRCIVRIMDLADDPATWVDYDAAHAPGGTPLAVIDAQRRHGIADMEIFRTGNRLVMLMHVTAMFDPDALDAEGALDATITAWNRRMEGVQRHPLPGGPAWPEAVLVFRQSDHRQTT